MADLALIQSFVTVYRAGSMTAAARLLNLTQPAVSKQMQAFEVQVGRALFERHARGLVPTAAAHALATLLAPHVDGVEASLAAHASGTAAVPGVTLLGGPMDMLAVAILPSLRAAIEHGISIRAEPGLPRELLTALADGALDLVVATQRHAMRGVRFEPLYTEQFVLVSAPEHAARLTLAIAERGAAALDDVPLLAYDDAMPLVRRYWRDVFGATPPKRAAMFMPNLLGLARAAVAGLGITVLPRYLIGDELRRGTLVLPSPATNAPTNTIWLASRVGDATPRTAFVSETLRRAALIW